MNDAREDASDAPVAHWTPPELAGATVRSSVVSNGLSGIRIDVDRPHLPAVREALFSDGYRCVPQQDGTETHALLDTIGWRIVEVTSPGEPRWKRVLPRRPVRGLIVAVVGPDGAGKGSLISELSDRPSPLPMQGFYLGSGGSGGSGHRPARRSATPTRPGTLRETAFVVRKITRAAVRLRQARKAARRGIVALCDRHPVEVGAIRPARHSVSARAVQLIGYQLLPRPDVVIVLDAPAEVLFERKAEHSVERLDAWRTAFRTRLASPRTSVISTDQPLERTVREARAVIWAAFANRSAP